MVALYVQCAVKCFPFIYTPTNFDSALCLYLVHVQTAVFNQPPVPRPRLLQKHQLRQLMMQVCNIVKHFQKLYQSGCFVRAVKCFALTLQTKTLTLLCVLCVYLASTALPVCVVISPAPKKRMHPIFSTTKTASCSAGGCSSAGCGSGSSNDNAAKTAKTLIRMRVLAKVAGPKQKECSDLQAANATVLVDCLDQDSLSAELDDTTSKLHFQTARAEKATARVAELETENECLREMLFDKIRQLEECQAKYDALKKELSKLRKSVSAYKRHGTKKTKGSKNELRDRSQMMRMQRQSKDCAWTSSKRHTEQHRSLTFLKRCSRIR